jgi:hypothetical protein
LATYAAAVFVLLLVHLGNNEDNLLEKEGEGLPLSHFAQN